MHSELAILATIKTDDGPCHEAWAYAVSSISTRCHSPALTALNLPVNKRHIAPAAAPFLSLHHSMQHLSGLVPGQPPQGNCHGFPAGTLGCADCQVPSTSEQHLGLGLMIPVEAQAESLPAQPAPTSRVGQPPSGLSAISLLPALSHGICAHSTAEAVDSHLVILPAENDITCAGPTCFDPSLPAGRPRRPMQMRPDATSQHAYGSASPCSQRQHIANDCLHRFPAEQLQHCQQDCLTTAPKFDDNGTPASLVNPVSAAGVADQDT